VPLRAKPGSQWRYSVSIDVLGAVIEQATDKPLPVAVAELVTTPLRMKDTAFSTKSASRLAVPYYNAEPAPKPMADPQAIPFAEGELVYSPSRALDEKAFPSGGAGMIGTILLTNTALEGMMGKVTADLRDAVYASGS